MSNSVAFPELREQAIALRRSGKSRREIKEILSIAGNRTLNEALRGEPPPPWTRRPNAKDDLREQARELRRQGFEYQRIAAELSVAKSSVSLWVRDLPVPDRLSLEERHRRSVEGSANYWRAERPRRAAARAAVRCAAAQQIGTLTDRELVIAGAIAYWCEGSKSKPYRRETQVSFMNSDPLLVKLYLKFLSAVGVSPERVRFRIYIHESADLAAALEFWTAVTEAEATQFRRPTLKRHNPTTVRKNTGGAYHGCLRVDVLRGAELYQRIEGWAFGVMMAMTSASNESPVGDALSPPDKYREDG
jgi:hypothetical protein